MVELGAAPTHRNPRAIAEYKACVDRAADAERLARTCVWWQESALPLAETSRLLRQILRFGRPENYVLAEQIWGEEALRSALTFWEQHLGTIPPGWVLYGGTANKLSFFGGIDFGRVGEPVRIAGLARIASRFRSAGHQARDRHPANRAP